MKHFKPSSFPAVRKGFEANVIEIKGQVRRLETLLSEFITTEQLNELRNFAFEYACCELQVARNKHGDIYNDRDLVGLACVRRYDLIRYILNKIDKKREDIEEITFHLPDVKDLPYLIKEGYKMT